MVSAWGQAEVKKGGMSGALPWQVPGLAPGPVHGSGPSRDHRAPQTTSTREKATLCSSSGSRTARRRLPSSLPPTSSSSLFLPNSLVTSGCNCYPVSNLPEREITSKTTASPLQRSTWNFHISTVRCIPTLLVRAILVVWWYSHLHTALLQYISNPLLLLCNDQREQYITSQTQRRLHLAA